MIVEHSNDHTGWALFSDDRKHRIRLARAVSGRGTFAIRQGWPTSLVWLGDRLEGENVATIARVVFVMLNPSTADAFKADPTIAKCVGFAKAWGADVLEVVNLFTLRSPHPSALDEAHERGEPLGTDAAANGEILNACTGALRVIAAWGNNGVRHGRAERVRELLADHGIRAMRLGSTQDGHPLHPLARGKSFIPLTRQPEVMP